MAWCKRSVNHMGVASPVARFTSQADNLCRPGILIAVNAKAPPTPEREPSQTHLLSAPCLTWP